MPRRSPAAADPQRLRLLLARRKEGTGVDDLADGDAGHLLGGIVRRGWVPGSPPPDADIGWLDDVGELDAVGELDSVDEVVDVDAPSARRGRRPTPVSVSHGGRHRRGPRLLTVPAALRGAQITVSSRAVLGMVAVLVLAGLLLAVRVARAEEAAAPEVLGTSGVVGRASPGPTAFATGAPPSPLGTSPLGTSARSPSARPSNSPSDVKPVTANAILVDVIGQVPRPGVVSVPSGARVVDVLAAVGGTLPSADVQRLNLARQVADGEQIFVPRPGETPPAAVGPGGAPSGRVDSSAPFGGAGSNTPVNLNAADTAALDALPGVGPVLAQRILDWRAQHGRFSTVDELGEVSGIGDKLLEQLRPRVRV